MRLRQVEPAFIVGVCLFELGGVAGLWRPLTHIFRERPATFVGFILWLFLHTWWRR